MKKFIKSVFSVIVSVVVLLCKIPIHANANDYSQDGWEYMENLYSFIEDNSKYTSTEFIVNSENQTETKECTNRLIVKNNSNVPIEDNYGAVAKFEGYNKLHIFQYGNIEDAKTAYNNFNMREDIVYVEFDEVIEVQSVGETQQYNYKPLSWASEAIGASELIRTIEKNSPDLPEVIVAVIDSAVEKDHKEFLDSTGNSRVLNGNRERDDKPRSTLEYHGTHVAGIILNNTPENVKVKPYNYIYYQINKVNGSYATLQNEINSAVNDGVDIINMSIGVEGLSSNSVNEAIDNAVKNGIIVVTSAGNSHDNAENNIPANYEKCITVAATGKDNNPLLFSNYGELVDLSAPGQEICSTIPFGVYMEDSGTSMAAPFVSAGAAVLKSLYPTMTAEEIENRIKNNVYVPPNWDTTKYGTGIINFSLMLEDLRSQKPTITLSEETITITATGNDIIYYTTDGSYPVVGVSDVYKVPIDMKDALIIKAIAYEDGKLPSAIVMLNINWSENIDVRYKGRETVKSPYKIEKYFCSNEEIVSFDGKQIKGESIGKATVTIFYETGQMVTYKVTVDFAPFQWFHKIVYKLFGVLLWSL